MEITKSGKLLKDITKIEEVSSSMMSQSENEKYISQGTSSIDSIIDSAENNNRKISENENVVKKSLSYEEAVDADLHQFIQTVAEGKLPKKAYYKISDQIDSRLAEDKEKLVGFSVEGYGNEISPDSIRHIINRHGENGKADRSMKNFEDIARIEYVINNYDNIILGEDSRIYKNGDGTNAQSVVLKKYVGGKYYYAVEAVPDTEHKMLRVASVFINKKDTFPAVGHAGINPPSPYVQNGLQSNVSANSINDSEVKDKREIQENKNSKRENSRNDHIIKSMTKRHIPCSGSCWNKSPIPLRPKRAAVQCVC